MQYRATRPLTRADMVWFIGVIVAVTLVGLWLGTADSAWERAGVGFGLGLAAVAIPLAQRAMHIRRNRQFKR